MRNLSSLHLEMETGFDPRSLTARGDEWVSLHFDLDTSHPSF